MKILLTGALGQVGQEVSELAAHRPCTLFSFSKADLDITNLEQVERAIKNTCPDLIINAAAYTAVDKAEQEAERAFAINRDGVKNLAVLGKCYNLPLIHISTDYVFDGSKLRAYEEIDPLSPLNVYGKSKAEGEEILQQEWEKHVIVRTSWVFGKHGSNFVKTILRLALKQKELRIVADQSGCPTAAADLAAALFELALQIKKGQPHWGLFHYCGEGPTTWFDFAGRIVYHGKAHFPIQLEKLHPIESADFPTLAQRPKNSVLNKEKIEKNYSLKPSFWEQGLVKVIEYLGKNGGTL
ncbi:MAG TPA: dTDP-4-dehydrorhamnose reductase [Gammaproteobacteria bacterium]|nr:dTDP-4-dehydrorhamnose reductase [Gammaproteobacteria bacterium]